MKNPYKILAIGDVVGPAAAKALCSRLPALCSELGASFVALNGENACVGNGLDAATAKMLLGAGADVITSGNHIWHKREIKQRSEERRVGKECRSRRGSGPSTIHRFAPATEA